MRFITRPWKTVKNYHVNLPFHLNKDNPKWDLLKMFSFGILPTFSDADFKLKTDGNPRTLCKLGEAEELRSQIFDMAEKTFDLMIHGFWDVGIILNIL